MPNVSKWGVPCSVKVHWQFTQMSEWVWPCVTGSYFPKQQQFFLVFLKQKNSPRPCRMSAWTFSIAVCVSLCCVTVLRRYVFRWCSELKDLSDDAFEHGCTMISCKRCSTCTSLKRHRTTLLSDASALARSLAVLTSRSLSFTYSVSCLNSRSSLALSKHSGRSREATRSPGLNCRLALWVPREQSKNGLVLRWTPMRRRLC